MKITKSYLRKLIKETIQEGWENEKAWTVTMRNSDTGKTEEVHVWTGAPDEEEAKVVAKSTSKYAGKEWVADAAELKESTANSIKEELTVSDMEMLKSAVESTRRNLKSGFKLRPIDVIPALELSKRSFEKNIKDEKLKRKKLAQVEELIKHVRKKGIPLRLMNL